MGKCTHFCLICIIFSYFITYRNTGVTFNFQFSYDTKQSMENIVTLILEDMSDRHMSDGQLYSFLQLFFNTEKIRLNCRLDTTVTDYMLLTLIAIPL